MRARTTPGCPIGLQLIGPALDEADAAPRGARLEQADPWRSTCARRSARSDRRPADYEAVIGLECHVELSTATKMFCGCANVFGAPPNTQTCPVCLGHAGHAAGPEREAIAPDHQDRPGPRLPDRAALAFARKNYFYPDMPKNYQISQYDLPCA